MQLDVQPSITMEQREQLFHAAVPELLTQLRAGASQVTAESVDGETLTVTSDKLDAPKVVALKGE